MRISSTSNKTSGAGGGWYSSSEKKIRRNLTQSPSVNSEDLGDILNEIIPGGQEDSPLEGGRGGALGDIEELPSEEDRDEDDEMEIEMQYMDIRENILAPKMKLMGKDENGGGHSGSSGVCLLVVERKGG